MKNLVIYNNSWIYILTLTVLKELGIDDFDILINPYYYNNKSQMFSTNCFLKLHTDKKILFIDEIDFDKYSKVFVAFPFIDKDSNLSKNIKDKELFLIEEGTSSYMDFSSSLSSLEKKLFNKGKFYVTKSEKIKGSIQINLKEICSIGRKFFFFDLNKLPKSTNYIIFTEPMEFEGDMNYPKKVSEFINNLPAGSKILIKRHPRDDSVYKFENKKVFYAPKDVPGQFLFSLYKDSVFVFTNYSIVELSMPKNCKKEVVLSTYNQKV